MSSMAKRERFDYAAQWDDEAPTELTLPSGRRCLVRTPDVLAMATQGLIPDNLTPLVERWIFEKEAMLAAANATDQPPGAKLKALAEYNRYVSVIVVGACVEPVVRFAPKAGEIHPDRIAPADQIEIWKWAEGLTGALSTFPDDAAGPTPDLPVVADGEGAEPATEPSDRAEQAA
jgi:hypothetical protein